MSKSRLHGRMLVVEDDTSIQRLVAKVLRLAGAEVDIESNGQQGFAAALAAWMNHSPYGVVLMDVEMPVLSGWEATRRLRAAGYPGPIIAVTSRGRNFCAAAGFDDHVPKPIDRERLLDAVETAQASH